MLLDPPTMAEYRRAQRIYNALQPRFQTLDPQARGLLLSYVARDEPGLAAALRDILLQHGLQAE